MEGGGKESRVSIPGSEESSPKSESEQLAATAPRKPLQDHKHAPGPRFKKPAAGD